MSRPSQLLVFVASLAVAGLVADGLTAQGMHHPFNRGTGCGNARRFLLRLASGMCLQILRVDAFISVPPQLEPCSAMVLHCVLALDAPVVHSRDSFQGSGLSAVRSAVPG